MCVITAGMAGTAAAAASSAAAAGTAAAAGGSLATALANAGLAASLVSGVVSGVSSYQSGKSQKAVAEYNAQQFEMQALDARARGAQEANLKRMEVKRTLAKQNAQLAAAGVDTSIGSSLTLSGDTAWAGELDARTIEVNALRQAYGFQSQSVGSRLQGRAAMRNARGESYGSLLAGVGSAGKTAAGLTLK